MALHFTETEFQTRENQLKQSMRDKNIDAMLLFHLNEGFDL